MKSRFEHSPKTEEQTVNNLLRLPDSFYASKAVRMELSELNIEAGDIEKIIPIATEDLVNEYSCFFESIQGMEDVENEVRDPALTRYQIVATDRFIFPHLDKVKADMSTDKVSQILLSKNWQTPEDQYVWASSILVVPTQDIKRRNKALQAVGIPEEASGSLASYWSAAACAGLVVANKAYSMTVDKKDLDQENQDYHQVLAFCLPAFGVGTRIDYSSLESVITRALSEGMAVKLLASQIDAIVPKVQKDVFQIRDELTTAQLRNLIDRSKRGSHRVAIEEIAAVNPFITVQIDRFLGV